MSYCNRIFSTVTTIVPLLVLLSLFILPKVAVSSSIGNQNQNNNHNTVQEPSTRTIRKNSNWDEYVSLIDWINPSDIETECSNDISQLGPCCLCNSCINTSSSSSSGSGINQYSINFMDNTNINDAQIITPFTPPLINGGDRFGSSLCVPITSAYVLGDCDPNLTYDSLPKKPETKVHLLENLDKPLIINNNYYLDIHHGTILNTFPSVGHILECYNEHILISDGNGHVQVFVKTQNPPWSLKYTISNTTSTRLPLSTDNLQQQQQPLIPTTFDNNYSGKVIETQFGKYIQYVNWTRQVIISDPSYGIVDIYSVYSTATLVQRLVIISQDDNIMDYTGSLSCSFPFLFVGSLRGTIIVFNYVQTSRVWVKFQTLHSSIYPMGSALSSTSNFLFITTTPSLDILSSATEQSNINTPVVVVYKKSRENNLQGSDSSVINQWELFQIISDPSTDGYISRNFGHSIDSNEYQLSNIDRGIRVVISDPFKPISASSSGIVYLYEFTSENRFKLCRTFTDKPLSFQSNFGYDIALSKSHLIVGAPETTNNFCGNIYSYQLSRETCIGCDMIMNSCSINDVCGVCNGNGTSCSGCDGIPYSGLKLDSCGVCDGDDSTCVSIFPKDIYSKFASCDTSSLYNFYVVIPMFEAMKGVALGQSKIEFQSTIIQAPECGNLVLQSFEEITIQQFNSASRDYQTKCISNCLYFRVNLLYTLDSSLYQSRSQSSRCVPEIGWIDNFQMSLQATKTLKPILLPQIARMELVFNGCKGCDDQIKPSVIDAKTFDRCLICGGNGQSCLDCLGIPFGDNLLDGCNQCTTEDKMNKSCITAQVKPEYETIRVQCKQPSLVIQELFTIGPINNQRSPRWKLLSKNSRCGSANIKHTQGTFTFTPNTLDDCYEQLVIEISDTWKNSFSNSIYIQVYGCNVVGCDGVKGSGVVIDSCMKCGGKNECLDCSGIPNGSSRLDICGVCNGDNSTCDVHAIQLQNMLIQYEEIEKRNIRANNNNGNGGYGFADDTLFQLVVFMIILPGIFVLLVLVIVILMFFTSRSRKKSRTTFYTSSTTSKPIYL